MSSLKSGISTGYTNGTNSFYPVERAAISPHMRQLGQHDFGTIDDENQNRLGQTVNNSNDQQRSLQPAHESETIEDLMNLDQMTKLGDCRSFVARNALTKFVKKQSGAKKHKQAQNPYRMFRFYQSEDGRWMAKSRHQNGCFSYVVVGDQPASEQEVWLVKIMDSESVSPQKVFQVSLVKKIFDESVEGIRVEMTFNKLYEKWSGNCKVGDTKVTCVADRSGIFYPTPHQRFWFASYSRSQHVTADMKSILCFVKLIREDTTAKEAHIRHMEYMGKETGYNKSNS